MSDDETIIKHESFGFIRASRTSGHAALFDSAVRHQHYITVTIGEATQERRYSESYIYPDHELIKVRMSEAQFAQFITSMNVGSGAPCTLERVSGSDRAGPPPDINTRETFEKEVQQRALAAAGKIQEAISTIEALSKAGKAGKRELAALRAVVESVQRDLVSNLPFLMKQFAEGIETLTERAKMDINAHAVMMGQRMMSRTSAGPNIGFIENNERPTLIVQSADD